MRRVTITATLIATFAIGGCKQSKPEEAETAKAEQPAEAAEKDGPDPAKLAEQAKGMFGTPKPDNTSDDPKVEEARVELGRMLYYEPRLSMSHEISCNTCHDLASYGVDVREKEGERLATSMGHKGEMGARNSPTTYNAYFHVAQFWDGRAGDVEEQAKGPVLNSVEMAMPDEGHVVKVLESIPGYRKRFTAAFPDAEDPVTYDNMARAIGAFERKLVTPAPIDAFMAGDHDALTGQQLEGLELFMERCTACHMGQGFGGKIFQKLGLMKPYETKDLGRFEVTEDEADKYFFKVPSLRNITESGPYLHDGSVATLEDMVQVMAMHQTVQGKLSDEESKALLAFLESLTGEIPQDLVAKPELPESGPKTPKPKKG